METLRLLAIEFSERIEACEVDQAHSLLGGDRLKRMLETAEEEHKARVEQINAVYEKAMRDMIAASTN